MNEIESHIKSDTITVDILKDIIQKYKRILKKRKRKTSESSKIKVI